MFSIHPPTALAKTSKEPDHIQSYQFKNAYTVSAEMENSLYNLFQSFAENLTINLPASLNIHLIAEVLDVQKMSVRQYLLSLNTNTFISAIDAMQIGSTIALEVNPIIVYGVINKMLGGDGYVPIFPPRLQNLEMAFVRKFFNQILIELSLLWKPLYSITFVINDISTTPTATEVLKPYESLLVTTFKLTLGSSQGLMTIALPSKIFGPLLGESGFHLKNDTLKTETKINTDDIDIPITATFGHINLTQAQLLSLQPGDIIPLEFEASPPAMLKIGEQKSFSAFPGLIGNKKGITLEKHISQLKENPWMT